jgi:hypothetical protein
LDRARVLKGALDRSIPAGDGRVGVCGVGIVGRIRVGVDCGGGREDRGDPRVGDDCGGGGGEDRGGSARGR